LTAAQGRKFGLTVGIAFLALTGLLLWREHAVPASVSGALGGLLVLAGLLVPTRLGAVERAWMTLAHAISRVTTPIVMGIVYFLVVTPIGLAVRVFGKNPLVHPQRQGGFWVDKAKESVRTGGMEHQY
jgi:hypothetical protein